MKAKLLVAASLSLLIAGCAESYVPIHFQTTNVSTGKYNAFSCRQINNEVDRALIETNQIFNGLLRDGKITSPKIHKASLYFNSVGQSELSDFSRLKGELAALETLSQKNDCGRYVMSPEQLIEYQLAQVRLGEGLNASTSYPMKIIRFDKKNSN